MFATAALTRTTTVAPVAAADPADVAVSAADYELTYRELDAWSNRLARVLLEMGAGPGTRVAMAVTPEIEAAVTRRAIVETGAELLEDGVVPFGATLGVTTLARRPQLTDTVRWLVLDDRSTLVRYLTGSAAPITDAERDTVARAS